MRAQWGRGGVAAMAVAGVLAIAGCGNSAAPSPAPGGSASSTVGGAAGSTGAADPGSAAGSGSTVGSGAQATGSGGAAGAGQLPANGDIPTDLDVCAILVAAAGNDAVTKAMGDPVVDSWTVIGNCSMETKEYTINTAGSTSTGRLSFGVATTSLAATAEQGGKPVDGLTSSSQGQNSIVWQRAPYWFSLQVLPVQKSASDPDVIDPAVLTALAKAINANA